MNPYAKTYFAENRSETLPKNSRNEANVRVYEVWHQCSRRLTHDYPALLCKCNI